MATFALRHPDQKTPSPCRQPRSLIETLEGRRLLSAALPAAAPAAATPPAGIQPPVVQRPRVPRAATQPVGVGVAVGAVEGVPFSGIVGIVRDVARFAPGMTTHALINWGDGTATDAGRLLAKPNRALQVRGTHTFARAGHYVITVNLTRSPNCPAGVACPTYVIPLVEFHGTAAVAPSPAATGLTLRERAGAAFTDKIGWFAYPNEIPVQSILALDAQVTWGDGGTSAGTLVWNGRDGYDLFGRYTYTRPGTYAIRAVVTLGPNCLPGGPCPEFPTLILATIESTAIVTAGSA